MRPCVLILAGLVSAVIAQAAGNPDTTYESLRNEAHVANLIKGVAADIKARRLDDALKNPMPPQLWNPARRRPQRQRRRSHGAEAF